jgi:Zinc-binding dehydrogenase
VTGQLAPQVDRVFPLAQAADAHRYMEASGKLERLFSLSTDTAFYSHAALNNRKEENHDQ